MKYPIGIQTFEQIIQDGFVYVDKTELIYNLVKNGKIYFLSRPRRFGKSLLVSTLKNYFLGKKELFKGLAIDKLETEWAEYPVFHIDFNGTDFTTSGKLKTKIESRLVTWEKIYGKDPTLTDTGDRFAYVLQQAHEKTGRRCVVLIDEYDKPLLDVLDTGYKVEIDGEKRLLEDHHREILKGFYSVFKAADADLQFVLLTGVTKFSQVSIFSGFNQPDDISMDAEYEALCGITQEELEHYFAEPIREMAEAEQCTVEEMLDKLKQHYDGYHFGKKMADIYNPFSLLNAFKKKDISEYWFKTATPTYLMRLLNHTQEELNELTRHDYEPSEFVDYKADVEKPLAMLYQSGYLTIKGYNREFGTFTLDYPNNEVKRGLVSLIANDYFNSKTEVKGWARRVTTALKSGNTDDLNRLFTSFLADIPYTTRRKDTERERERYFHYTFYLIFRILSTYVVYTEKEQSQGRADCIVETPKFIYIFEFKLDGSADEALAQIEAKGYAAPYAADTRKLFKIGVNFSSETGTVEEWEVVSDSPRIGLP